MGENIVRCAPGGSPPQRAKRSTAEITTERLNALIREPVHEELEPELELIAGLPSSVPEATPINLRRASSPRLAHTLRRRPTIYGVPGRTSTEPDTRPIAPVLPLPTSEAPCPVPPPVPAAAEQRIDMLPPVEVPRPVRPLVAGPPKRPPAPRSWRDNLGLPMIVLLLASGAVTFWLLR